MLPLDTYLPGINKFCPFQVASVQSTMSPRQSVFQHVLVILGIGFACFLLFLMLIPNVEASRTEVRLAETYYRVRQIAKAHHETSSLELFKTHEIPDTDPWGQPYRLLEVDGKQMRALSWAEYADSRIWC